MELSELKVLVVDDVGFVRRTFQQMLKNHGISVETAESGKEAVQILQRNQTIDVVITDLYMPGMNGVELFNAVTLIERVNDSGRVAPPKFILATESGTDTDVRDDKTDLIQHAKDIGFIDIVRKPVDESHLIYILGSLANNGSTIQCVGSEDSPDASSTDPIQQSLQELRKMVGELIGVADVEALLLMHDSLSADLSRIDGALSMYEPQPIEAEA
jgi:CheY-like chemotaxis protein